MTTIKTLLFLGLTLALVLWGSLVFPRSLPPKPPKVLETVQVLWGYRSSYRAAQEEDQRERIRQKARKEAQKIKPNQIPHLLRDWLEI